MMRQERGAARNSSRALFRFLPPVLDSKVPMGMAGERRRVSPRIARRRSKHIASGSLRATTPLGVRTHSVVFRAEFRRGLLLVTGINPHRCSSDRL